MPFKIYIHLHILIIIIYTCANQIQSDSNENIFWKIYLIQHVKKSGKNYSSFDARLKRFVTCKRSVFIKYTFLLNGFAIQLFMSLKARCSKESVGGRKKKMYISGAIGPIRDQCVQWETDKKKTCPPSFDKSGSRARGWHTVSS